MHVVGSGPFVPLCENMTLSTKPEVHNILHCRQSRAARRPQVTCTENVVARHVLLFEIYEQTDMLTTKALLHGGKVIMKLTAGRC